MKIIGIYIDSFNADKKEHKQNIGFGELSNNGSFNPQKRYFDFRKILKSDEFYPFDNNYNIDLDQKEQNTLTLSFNDPIINLYSIDNFEISVSAIVGKNGSGKSTLIELMYLMIYNLSIKTGDLTPSYPTPEKAENYYMPYLKAKLILKTDTNEYGLLNFDINEMNNSNAKNKITYHIAEIEGNNIKFDLAEDNFDKFDLNNFLYTIGMNYSVFGLNNMIIGNWIQQLFHKNDSYQTPIVLNPYKEFGQYDAYREVELSKDRMVLNSYLFNSSHFYNEEKEAMYISSDYDLSSVIYSYLPYHKSIKNDFYLDKVLTNENVFENKLFSSDIIFPTDILEFDHSKIVVEHQEINRLSIFRFLTYQYNRESEKEIVKRIFHELIDHDTSFIELLKREINISYGRFIFINELLAYIIYKIYRIVSVYFDFFLEYYDKDNLGLIKNFTITNFLNKDKSHKTLKLQRAIALFLNIDVFLENWGAELTPNALIIKANTDYFKTFLEKSKRALPLFLSLINDFTILPPSIFNQEIELKNKQTNQKVSFSTLSSGELQIILLSHTLLYHLLNVQSNHNSSDAEKNTGKRKPTKFKTYKHILALFDEVELYFHPEYQRILINELISLLQSFKIGLSNIKSMQLVFVTHSPFILSDIPANNILRIEEGAPISNKKEKTFGANIYSLLKNQFFLRNGFQGEFAKKEIRKVYLELYYAKIEKELNRLKNEEHTERINTNLTSIKNNISIEYNEIFGSKIDNELEKILVNNEKYKELIDIIGEPIIKQELESLYNYVFLRKENSTKNINILLKQMKELGVSTEELINKLDNDKN